MRAILTTAARASIRLVLLLAVLLSATFVVVVLLAIPRVLADRSQWRDLGIFGVVYYGIGGAAVLAAVIFALMRGWRLLRGR